MKLYLVRITDEKNNPLNFARKNEVLVFEKAAQRETFISEMKQMGRGAAFEKLTCEFAATKKGIISFFNCHAWHE